MIFSSPIFLLFIIPVLIIYWRILSKRSHKIAFLTLASCFFYATWSAKWIFLLLFSIAMDYYFGHAIARNEDPKRRKRWLAASIVTNLTILGIFKYTNFFLQSAAGGFRLMGFDVTIPMLNIILPLGISFYTFHSMNYVIDVYYKRIEPCRSLIDYACFVTCFPQLIAGPIMRARDFLPQLIQLPAFSFKNFTWGIDLFLLGLVKKLFIADRLAVFVDEVFGHAHVYDGVTTWLAVVAYAFQIYCDFSGYSDMARGLGRMLGLDFMLNFRMPYLSGNMSEFWQRWHISLSTWLRDYLFMPLGGYRGSVWKSCRNLFITMFLGGLWHGASWTFVAWGVYHGILLALRHAINAGLDALNISVPLPKALVWLRAVFYRLFVFALVCIGWVFFRSQTFSDAAIFFSKMFTMAAGERWISGYSLFLISFMVTLDLAFYAAEKNKLSLQDLGRLPPMVKAFGYACAFVLLLVFSSTGSIPFIYFQF